MRRQLFVLVLAGLCILASSALFAATDYGKMTTEEMCRSYSTSMQNPSESQAYQQELNRRLESMTPEQRQRMYQQQMSSQSRTGTTSRDYSSMSNQEFYQMCQNQGFMQGLTPEQRREIDQEWQRRIPYMTRSEVQKYYPEGRRYYTGS